MTHRGSRWSRSTRTVPWIPSLNRTTASASKCPRDSTSRASNSACIFRCTSGCLSVCRMWSLPALSGRKERASSHHSQSSLPARLSAPSSELTPASHTGRSCGMGAWVGGDVLVSMGRYSGRGRDGHARCRAGFTGENRAWRDERVCELSRSGFGTHRILYGPRVRVHVARRGEAHKASRILQDGQKDGQGGSKQPPADPRPQERPHEERRREEESPRDVGGDPTRLGFTPAPHPAPHGCVHVSLKKVREKDFSLLHV